MAVDVAELHTNPKAIVQEVVAELAKTPDYYQPPELEIVEVLSDSEGGSEIRFIQTIEGHPVEFFNVVALDPEGNVVRVQIKLAKPTQVDAFVPLDRTSAERIAIEAVQAELADSSYKVGVDENTVARVFFRFVSDQLEVAPYWGVDGVVATKELDEGQLIERFSAEVDPRSLNVTVRRAGYAKNFIQTTVCKPLTGQLPRCDNYTQTIGWPPIPIMFTYDKVYSELTSGVKTCTQMVAGSCGTAKFMTPWDVVQDLELLLGAQLPSSICCEDVGNVNILVDANTSVNASVAYYPGTNNNPTPTIVFPKTANLNPANYNGQDPSKSADVVAHEFAHHVVRRNNLNLFHSNDAIANQIEEAIADVIAAIYAKSKGQADSSAWRIGEDVLQASATPTLSTPRKFKDESSYNAFGKRQMYGNFFYRLQQRGVSNNDLIRIVGHVIETVVNDGANWDSEDFKRSVDSYTTDSVLQSKIDQVFADMEYFVVPAPPPVGGGSGVPSAPFLSGSFSSCSGGFSVHTLSWTAPSGASRYDAYAIQPNGALGFEGSTSSTSSPVSTNFNTVWYIRACNSSGCSAYSNGFTQFHSCH
ncbi:MAG: hypothetical protein RLO46_02030 [Pseudomonadales bacterium]